MLVLQLCLYCFLFFLPVQCAVGRSGRNCLYFYPKQYCSEAYRRNIADPAAVQKQAVRFMVPFCTALLAALVLIISVWNRVTDFKTAYLQAVLFLVVVNWFDGIVLDRLWVGHSKIWIIEGMEDVPYIKPWKTVLIKRSLATLLYLILALAIAGIVVLLGRIPLFS